MILILIKLQFEGTDLVEDIFNSVCCKKIEKKINCFVSVFQHGNTPLHEAAWRGYSRCVKLLCTLQHTPRSSSKKIGKKPKNVKNVENEWKNDTYLNTSNAGGFSSLHLAAQNGHNQSCREILLAGANPDVKNNVSCNYIGNCSRR